MSWIDLDMAAAGAAILANPYPGGDPLPPPAAITDAAHLLALRALQLVEGVDVVG